VKHELRTFNNTSSAGIIRSLAPGNAAMGIRIIVKHLREKQNNREKSELCVASRTAKWHYSLFAICTETNPLFVLFKK